MGENQFLYKEYEECLNQSRFYDDRHSNFVKYVATISSSVGAILLALLRLYKDDIGSFLFAQSFICLIVFVCVFVILLCMIRNRLYSTFVFRQVNAIRKFLLQIDCPEFKDNQMYLSTNFPAFKFFSTQTLMIFGIAFVSSIYLAASAFSLSKLLGADNCLQIAVWTLMLGLALELFFLWLYISIQGKKSADQAIHGE